MLKGKTNIKTKLEMKMMKDIRVIMAKRKSRMTLVGRSTGGRSRKKVEEVNDLESIKELIS